MTSEPYRARRVFVWTWLPGESTPVVAGAVDRVGADRLDFTYARSYLDNERAISLYTPELPLRRGTQEPMDGLTVAACLRDATPDSWGERVIGNRLGSGDTELSVETYMLESGSNRLGAIDFQESPEDYSPRVDTAGLDELYDAAEKVLAGEPLNPAIGDALMNGTAIGGAHPKVLISDDSGVEHLAKLSVSSDVHPWVRAEAVAIELARLCGIEVPKAHVIKSVGREVLLIERFDRPPGGRRRHVVSGLTMLGFDALLGARYGSYPEMLDVLREWGRAPQDIGHRLFERIVFNIAVGNNDDHARNHAAFWDGTSLELTPAFDLTPQPRSTDTSAQAMAIGRDGSRASRFSVCVAAAADYGLSRAEAGQIVERIVATVENHWSEAADAAGLSEADRNLLWKRSILNRSSFYD
ncbi:MULTISPECIES: type II toxin-antitoxin system HipA family toxin [unclassified Nocardioides]|uniref:type II toxin-antitoxin system HipA family toxin n=1 Tax=unclassified Nocardioides TaxID=2615069 RepID=UPI000057193E|nr:MULTISPECIES: type II toxin-antitoxin system HipA family toxin [unclassified Nocardioides]ABL81870.1 HipA domain protein [Nocardioides sp. JS614]